MSSPIYGSKVKEEKLDQIDQILKNLDRILSEQYTYNGVVSCVEAAVLTYFCSDLTENVHLFKNLMKRVKELLDEKFDEESAKSLYEDSVNLLDKFATTKEYDENHEVLDDIKYELALA